MNRIFNTIFVLFVVYISISIGQSVWVKQNSPVDANLKQVVFVDSLYGWIAGDSGVILHTSNGGNNWIVQYRDTLIFFNDIYFLNRSLGWAVAWNYDFMNFGTHFFKTTNGGQFWSRYFHPDTMIFANCIYFFNENRGWIGLAMSNPVTIFETSDGGATWDSSRVELGFVSNFPVRAIKFADSLTGVAGGGFIDIAGVVWMTTNGGYNWVSDIVGAEPFYDVEFKNENDFFVCGGDYEYGVSTAYSTNSGVNWNYRTLDIFGMGLGMGFRNQQEAWITSNFSQKLIYTTDGGSQWFQIDAPDSSTLYGLNFANQITGWSVGNNGTILKYINNSVNIKNEFGSVFDFKLFQNYPNPFNSSTNLRFQLSYPSMVTIKVYDVLGREVSTILNEMKHPGEHRLRFDASDLPSGIYFYRIISTGLHNGITTDKSGKMLITK